MNYILPRRGTTGGPTKEFIAIYLPDDCLHVFEYLLDFISMLRVFLKYLALFSWSLTCLIQTNHIESEFLHQKA